MEEDLRGPLGHFSFNVLIRSTKVSQVGNKLKKTHHVLERLAADGLGFDSASSVGLYYVFRRVFLWNLVPVARRTEKSPS